MAFSGDGMTSLDMPALDNSLEFDNNLYLDFSGMQGQIAFNIVRGEVAVQAQTDGLKLSSPGQGQLQVGKVRIESDSRRGVADLMLGKGNFTIQHIALSDQQRGFDLAIRDVGIDAATYAEGSNINMLARYQLAAIEADNQLYGPIDVEFELTSISAEAMARIQENIKDMQRQQVPPEQQGMAIMGVFMSVMPAMLEQNPGMALKKFMLNTPQGRVEASLSLKVDNMSITDMGVSEKFLQKLVGDASLKIPESLLYQLMANTTRQQLMVELMKKQDEGAQIPGPEEIERLVEMQVTSQLEGIVGQGFLERQGTDLVAVASLKAGQLSVNGKVIQLPEMQ